MNQSTGTARAKQEPARSKDLGLEIGLIVGNYFLNTRDLHYGYWTDDLPRHLNSLARAQELHSELILDHIPDGVKTILDVGGGAGNFAAKMVAKGYQVDVITYSDYLAGEARNQLGDGSRVWSSKFEDWHPDRKYDLVLFSESFQYVDIATGLQRSTECLAPGGHLLICDFFHKDVKGKSPIKGGHKWVQFAPALEALPFSQIEDVDITPFTAPTHDVLNEVIQDVGHPIYKLLDGFVARNHPWLHKVLSWKFQKKIAKIDRKYWSGAMTGDAFSEFKTYRLMVYRWDGDAA